MRRSVDLLYGPRHLRFIALWLLPAYIIQKEHAGPLTHGWDKSSQNTHALLIGPVMKDKLNQEHVGFHGLRPEEVVR